MRKGFRIMIESGLSTEDKMRAERFIRQWASKVLDNNCSWAEWSRGGWRSYLRRNAFGYSLDGRSPKTQDSLVFRRISKNRRIFAVMRARHLKTLDGQEVDVGRCICPMCLGGTRVTIPKMPELRQMIEYGEVKG